MKKILYSLIAVLAMVMSSCSNDDIEVLHSVNIKVNPSKVISTFTYEYQPGELESFPDGYKLRVRLLAYDTKGVLKDSATQYLTNYGSIAGYNLKLEEGDYTLVAITDVVEIKGNDVNLEYWHLKNRENLSETQLSDAGLIGGQHKILGIESKNFTIDKTNKECILYPQAVGALCYVVFHNIHQFPDVKQYSLEMTKASDFLQFNGSGEWLPSVKNNDGSFDWYLAYTEPEETESYGTYGYYFMLPMPNVNFKFTYDDTNGDSHDLTQKSTVSLEAGVEYGFQIELVVQNNQLQIYSTIGEVLNGSAKAHTHSLFGSVQKNVTETTCYVKDCINKNAKK